MWMHQYLMWMHQYQPRHKEYQTKNIFRYAKIYCSLKKKNDFCCDSICGDKIYYTEMKSRHYPYPTSRTSAIDLCAYVVIVLLAGVGFHWKPHTSPKTEVRNEPPTPTTTEVMRNELLPMEEDAIDECSQTLRLQIVEKWLFSHTGTNFTHSESVRGVRAIYTLGCARHTTAVSTRTSTRTCTALITMRDVVSRTPFTINRNTTGIVIAIPQIHTYVKIHETTRTTTVVVTKDGRSLQRTFEACEGIRITQGMSHWFWLQLYGK